MRFFNLPTYSNTPDGTESIPSSDANQTDRRFTLSGLAKWIVETYNESTIAGAARTLKNAIDTVDVKQWTATSGMTTDHQFAVITDTDARRRVNMGRIAKWVVESYTGSTVAGSEQAVKTALDTLNTNVGTLQVTVTSLTNGSTTTITLKRGGRYIAIISRANTAVATYGGLYLIQAHDAGYIRAIASSDVASLSISGTTLSASASATYVGLTLICLNN